MYPVFPRESANIPMLMDRASYRAAMDLLAAHGDDAGLAAADLADNARESGDDRSYARWRQIERMLVALSIDGCFTTIH